MLSPPLCRHWFAIRKKKHENRKWEFDISSRQGQFNWKWETRFSAFPVFFRSSIQIFRSWPSIWLSHSAQTSLSRAVDYQIKKFTFDFVLVTECSTSRDTRSRFCWRFTEFYFIFFYSEGGNLLRIAYSIMKNHHHTVRFPPQGERFLGRFFFWFKK